MTITAPQPRTPNYQPNVGDVVTATIGGKVCSVTITRVNPWTIATSDWRLWWNVQEGHGHGQSVHNSDDHLHI